MILVQNDYMNDREGGHNMDVEGAWRQGFTGRGVSVTILDDGIEKDHPGDVAILFLIFI